ncbi:divergent protein kinase domain 2A [Procambarus clarkii]|uniref:divergent protein kinase domain 2A n=1 Tax=Procambarus clarkii TaxID=6728 RepID=UPI001E671B63|nr:divergent protein kinase domain 2A-like [Procambarus clarkii]XP_045601999.1 divergent protein kinase domain 2A-like [Procambarus clarkii]
MPVTMRRRRKTWLLCGLAVVVLVYLCGWYQRLDKTFVALHTCPACYGQTLCSHLLHDEYSSTTKIQLTGFSTWKIMNFFNVKNVYYGESAENSVVLKKLAHDSELKEFDSNLCKASRDTEQCDVSQAIKTLLIKTSHNFSQIISRYPQLFKMSEGVKCNHNRSIQHLYDNYVKLDNGPYHHHHFITMLAVNMEPLILNAYQHQQWFPSLHGMCGRVMVESYVGPTLTQLSQVPWIVRADYAHQLLELAQDFTDGDVRLYLTDVSLDNFAVDSNGKVKIIDAENIVMVDPSIPGLDPTEHVNDGFGCRDCLSFSYEDLCGHTSSDHNFFAVCKGMLSSSAFSQDLPEGLLHTAPSWVMEKYPLLFSLVEDCAGHPYGNTYTATLPTRKKAAAALHTQLLAVLHKGQKSS